MRFFRRHDKDEDLRARLPEYGAAPTQPVTAEAIAAANAADAAEAQRQRDLQRDAFRREELRREETRHAMRQELRHEELARELRLQRRRTRTVGLLLTLAVGVVLAVFVTHNLTDPRSLGTQLDDAVANVKDAGAQAGQKLADSQNAVVQASQGTAEGVSTSLTDTAISAKVKAALVADPALKASQITVTTTDGVVRLQGPAPDAKARDRASVLAGAPDGVLRVDNQLTLPGQVVATAQPDTTQLPSQTAPQPAQ